MYVYIYIYDISYIYHICSLVIQHNPANCQGLVELIFQTPKSWRQKSPNWPGEPCIVHDLSRAEKKMKFGHLELT